MRLSTFRFFVSALLGAAMLFAVACNRGEETAGQASTAQTAQQDAPPPPPPNELSPAPQSVDVHEASSDLDNRERQIAAREALLAAREQRLRDRQDRPSARREEPRPAPTAPAKDSDADEAPAPKPAAAEPESEEPAPELRTTSVTVPAGTQLDVELTNSLASNSSEPGESFRVRVAHDVTAGGEVAIPAGAEILGEVTEAVPLRKVGGQARLGLRFTDLVLPSGVTVPIDASFVQQGRSETGKDAATIGGGAAAGAVLGRILNQGHRGKGAVIGAILGAAAGTAIAAKTAGEEVVIPAGTVLTLKLDNSVRMTVPSRR